MGGRKARTATDMESALGCGGYQIFIFVVYQMTVCLQCANMVFMSFAKVAPSRWFCDDGSGNGSDYSVKGQNGTSFFTDFNQTDQCASFADGSCSNLRWETDFYSIVPEWRLICDRTGIVYLIMSVQMLGVLIGSALFGQLSDTFGRKWTLFFAQLSLILLDGLSILSPNWQAFLSFRFFIGLTCGGTITISYVYLTEVLKAKHRLWVTSIGGWPPAFAVFAALAFATRDWKRLSLAVGALGVPSLLMIPLATESPRWLLQKQKLDEAKRSVERVMKWNREDESVKARAAQIVGGVQEYAHPLRTVSRRGRSRRYTFWHLCRTRKMATNITVLVFAYLAISMITYGIVLNNDKLMGDKYLNFFLFACIRWIASILTPVVDAGVKCCGRKLTATVSFAVVFLAATAISLIFTFAPDAPTAGNAVTGLVLLSSMLSSPIWASLNLASVEAFPTPIRNIAVGVTAAFTRLGGVIVPVFLYMAELWKPSPYVLFAIMALLSSVLCAFLLPETKGKALPDEMPERQERWWCCCSDRDGERPLGTIRSDSFTVFHFSSTRPT